MSKLKGNLKPYQCSECGTEEEFDTNHYGECYPFCKVCNKQTVWKFTGEVPEGGWIPPKWNSINLTSDN